jgi:hypothetical protein
LAQQDVHNIFGGARWRRHRGESVRPEGFGKGLQENGTGFASWAFARSGEGYGGRFRERSGGFEEIRKIGRSEGERRAFWEDFGGDEVVRENGEEIFNSPPEGINSRKESCT